MEKWKEVFIDKIPEAFYQIQLINGEEQGLIIELSSDKMRIIIKFGMVQAVRMLDEGIVQSNLYSDNEIKKYKCNNFKNVIYEVQGGEFIKQVNEISNGYGEILNLKHYVVINQNYNIDIVSETEPIIDILQT